MKEKNEIDYEEDEEYRMIGGGGGSGGTGMLGPLLDCGSGVVESRSENDRRGNCRRRGRRGRRGEGRSRRRRGALDLR